MLQGTEEAVAPLYAATWPETPEKRVTIVCEGPSAYWAQPDVLHAACLDGPVVAINRAIAFSDVLPIDVWATSDDPRNLWEWAQPCLHPETKLFSLEDRLKIWGNLIPDLTRLYVREPTHMVDEGLKDANGLYPLVPTLFPVLAWVLSQGATDVRLVGVDMDSTSSPFLHDWQEDTDQAHLLRWSVEREFLAHSIRFYRAKGARITRWDRSKTTAR